MRSSSCSTRTHLPGKSWPLVILVALASCLDPYDVNIDSHSDDLISVDGFIDATAATATVDIKHAIDMNSTGPFVPETGATVTITTGHSAHNYILNETSEGRYTTNGLPIDFEETYVLTVSTRDGREVTSTPITLQRTSAIEDIAFAPTADGQALEILVSSTPVEDHSRYYVWDYIETYEYTATYFSGWKRVNNIPVQRKDEDLIYRCWRTNNSLKFTVANTLSLGSNLVRNMPIAALPKGSPKLAIRYSVLVRQRGVDENEFRFLKDLKQTNEQIGGLFDPAPFQVIGNLVDNANPGLPVLGYFSGSEVSLKRSFISYDELPQEFQRLPPVPVDCEESITCSLNPPPGTRQVCIRVEELGETNIITSTLPDPRGGISAYKFAPMRCADCRFYGGVTTRPDFW